MNRFRPHSVDYLDYVASNRRSNSSNFLQFITEDDSLDYSVNWDSFSFETEIKTRKNILEEDIKAYKELLDQPLLNDIVFHEAINELQENKELSEELFTENEDIYSKYKSLIIEHKRIMKDDLKKLTEQNERLQENMKCLKNDESTSRKNYQQMKLALQRASEMYTSHFGIDVSTRILSDSTYEASVYFKHKDVPIVFTVDRVNRKVLGFQCNGISPKEEEEIRKEFSTFDNLPGLFCKLRDIIFKR